MKKPRLFFATMFMVSLCSQQAFASSDGFSIELEGLQKFEGRSVVKLGFGANMKYNFATSDASISVAMPGERLTIRLLKTGMNCQNFGDANIGFGDEVAEISGKVGCLAKGAPMDQREDLAVQGWFKLD